MADYCPMKWRITSLIFIFGILYLVLIFNIYNLQFEKRDYYLARAMSQQETNGVIEPTRGNIYFADINNNLIQAALNKEYSTIFAVPKEIRDVKTAAQSLSEIIDRPKEELEKILNKPNDPYELLLQKANSEQIKKIKNLDIYNKGIYIGSNFLRFYPFGDLASHILGFISPQNKNEVKSLEYQNIEIGRYGVESYFNDILTGKPNETAGNNIILTIDREIQNQAEKILKKLIEQYQAVGGTVIVEEPQTGKILAMGSFPNFDPNNYSKFNIEKFLNPAVQAVYEPGSVFKLITMSAGIDSGKITPETTYIDTGSVILNSKTIKNADLKIYGKQTMNGVIEHSINTGAVFAEQKTGDDIFYNYLIKFGFDKTTGIFLPGEVKGNINNLKNGRDIDFATASFGQGVAVTPIELINAISAIANGGILMKPLILSNDKPQVIRRVISSETAKAVTGMMVSSVEKNKIAAISNYSVAGKTGTALVPDFSKVGYTDQVINTFVGFAPASQPKFIILIKLDKPAGGPLAGLTVVPAFRELAQFILNYYNIAPDRLASNQ